MNIDGQHTDRYLICYPDGRIGRGWAQGIAWTQGEGSPPVVREADKIAPPRTPRIRQAPPLDLEGLWPDTVHYDQNTPGILAKSADYNRRYFADWFDHEVWQNLLRVPCAFAYLGACAKVQPRSILELGTGGDSAHSTGMFQFWLGRALADKPTLHVSVDRHYLSHTWLRYRENPNWHFIQGDSMAVLKALRRVAFPNFPPWWDLIFIDSSHLYRETLDEIRQSSLMTHAMLFDDTTTEGVAQALAEFQASKEGQEWLRVDIWPTVCLLERHEHVQ